MLPPPEGPSLDTEETGFRASVGPGRPGRGEREMHGMHGFLLLQLPGDLQTGSPLTWERLGEE